MAITMMLIMILMKIYYNHYDVDDNNYNDGDDFNYDFDDAQNDENCDPAHRSNKRRGNIWAPFDFTCKR